MYELTFPVWTTLPLERRTSWYNDLKHFRLPYRASWTVSNTVRLSDIGDIDLCVTTCNSKNLDTIEWERLHNAAVYIHPRAIVTDYEVADEHEEYDALVLILPLNFVAALSTDNEKVVAAENILVQLRWPDAAMFPTLNTSKAYWSDHHNKIALDSRYAVNDAIFICNGERLTSDNVCQKCPDIIRYGLGECELLAINCSACTTVRPDLHDCSSPLIHRLLPAANYKNPKECIATPPFKHHDARNLWIDIKSSYVYQERRDLAKVAGATTRLRNTMCKTCVMQQDEHGGCVFNPHVCSGPILRSDIELRDCDEEVEPWQYDVLMCYGDRVPLKEARKYLSGLKYARNPLCMVGPYKTQFVPCGNYDSVSPSVKRGCSRVVTLRRQVQSDYGERYAVSYKEFCRLLNKKEVNTWTQLYKQYPYIKKRSPYVRLAAKHFITARRHYADLVRFNNECFIAGTTRCRSYGGDYEDLAKPSYLFPGLAREFSYDQLEVIREILVKQDTYAVSSVTELLFLVRKLDDADAVRKKFLKRNTRTSSHKSYQLSLPIRPAV